MKLYSWVIVGTLLCLTSCNEDVTMTTVHDNLNAPVSTNVFNSFTYSINANRYSDKNLNDLTFLSDSLVVTLSSSGYNSGQAILTVSDSLHATIFSDTIKSNKTVTLINLKIKRPRYCSIDITNLTAKLAFVIVGQ